MRKRTGLIAFICLILIAALAAPTAVAQECTCTVPCAEGAADLTCPVCAADAGQCALREPACAHLEGCGEGAHAPGCPLYTPPDSRWDAYENLAQTIQSATGPVTVAVTESVEFPETLYILDGQDVTLSGGGTLFPSDALAQSADACLLSIEPGGRLTLDGVTIQGLSSQQNPAATLVWCAGRLTLNEGVLTGARVTRDTNSGAVVVQGSEACFVMNGGSIENNTIDCISRCGSVFVSKGGVFELYGGAIRNNQCTQESYALEPATAGVMVVSELADTPDGCVTSFQMYGGTIENNRTTGSAKSAGGGVCLWGPDWSNWSRYSRMTLSGGTIQNNTTVYGGGGIFVYGLACLEMTGGEIRGNQVTDGMGGGICAYDGLKDHGLDDATIASYSTAYSLARLVLDGGQISENLARQNQSRGDGGCGGGIYIATMNAQLKQGRIQNNEADQQGGGIYVGSTPYVLEMANAVIKNNRASVLGGGLWLCPTGDATSVVTNGGAIFDNTAPGPDAAADDIAIVPQGDTHYADLSVRMLGGGQVTWYRDGGVTDRTADGGVQVLGLPDFSVYGRYEKDVFEQIVTQIQGRQEGLAVKCVASDEAKALAETQAGLWVTDNRSRRGGGIGSNGGVFIGVPHRDYTLTVCKDWGAVPADRQTALTVHLKIGGYVLDGVTLDASNQWTASFTGLPDPSSLVNAQIQVEETPVPGFEASYSDPVIDPEQRTIRISVLNRELLRTGSLQVTKEVTGSAADTEADWHFTVTLDDATLSGRYGEMDFTDGVASFSLKHNQSKTATGLPAGVQYTVRETEAGQNGYQSSATQDTGTISADRTAVARFVNTKDSAEPPAPQTPPAASELPQTGDSTVLWPWALVCLSALAALFVLWAKRRAHR